MGLIGAVVLMSALGVGDVGKAGAGAAIVAQGSAGGSPACVGCHGTDLGGVAAAKAPALAGKPAAYILQRLAYYAGPEGHNAMMKQVATALTPADRAAVANYISHLPVKK